MSDLVVITVPEPTLTVAASGEQGIQGVQGDTGATGPQGNPTTVNGLTGASITLTPADVGAAPSSGIAQSAVTNLVSDLSDKANIASPTFTDVPAAPTAAALTSTTQIATTAFVTIADGLKADKAPEQNAITTVTYTAVLLDAGKTLTRSNAAASTHTIPAQATVAWAANTQLNILNIGAGTVTITPAAGVTINGTPLTLTTSQGGRLVRTASNVWTFTATGSGLTLITSQSFSGVASVSVDNCFTTSYYSYKIVCRIIGSAGVILNFRLRNAGVDTASSYFYGLFGISSVGGSVNKNANGAGQFFIQDLHGGFLNAGFIMDLVGPNNSGSTSMYLNSTALAGDAGGFFVGSAQRSNGAHDGFSLLPASGNVSGEVKIYGYRN